MIFTSVYHFPFTVAQARKGIPEFEPILLLDYKNHSVTISHKSSPTGIRCKTRRTNTRKANTESKQTSKILKQRRKIFEIISPFTLVLLIHNDIDS